MDFAPGFSSLRSTLSAESSRYAKSSVIALVVHSTSGFFKNPLVLQVGPARARQTPSNESHSLDSSCCACRVGRRRRRIVEENRIRVPVDRFVARDNRQSSRATFEPAAAPPPRLAAVCNWRRTATFSRRRSRSAHSPRARAPEVLQLKRRK